MTRKDFLQRYWSYYLILEEKFRITLNYVELDERNAFSFSNEYALLLQSIGAELDNFFKVYCGFSAQVNIPVRRRRLSGIPGSKSPAEWEA
jgi:hypothetical protein